MSISNMLKNEQPRERLLQKGVASLTTNELIAILFQTGSKKEGVLELSKRFINNFNCISELNNITIQELMQVKGVGISKACKILASIELGKRVLQDNNTNNKYYVNSPLRGAEYVMLDMQHLKQENFVVLYLDTKNAVITRKTVFVGSLNKAIAHPREIFKYAYQYSAAKIMCFHNHPSGDPKPSEQDILLTRKLLEIGSLLGISFLDHIIIGKGTYISLKEEGYM